MLEKYLSVFIMSMVPVIELRGGMITAVTVLGLPLLPSYLVCVAGNILPVPFLLLFVRVVLGWCCRLKKIGGFFQRIWDKS